MNAMHFKAARLALALAGALSTVGASAFDQIPLTLDEAQSAAEADRANAIRTLKSSKAPTNYFTPNILRKSWSRLVVSVVHLDALAFPVAAT